MSLSRFVRLFVLALVLTPLAFAQTATAPMTNDDVIALAGAGLGDEIVIAKINAAPKTNFDTSVAGLKALKAAGVSIEVVKAMIAPARTTVAAATEALPDPDDFNQVQPSGIYAVVSNGGGAAHLTRITYATPEKIEPYTAFPYVKIRARFAGLKAPVEFSDVQPTFYIYPKSDDAATLKDLEGFKIVKMNVNKKDRDVSLGEARKGELDEKIVQPSKVVQVKNGIYKVTLEKPLEPGEYAFYSRGTWHPNVGPAGGGDFFEFGVTGTPDQGEGLAGDVVYFRRPLL